MHRPPDTLSFTEQLALVLLGQHYARFDAADHALYVAEHLSRTLAQAQSMTNGELDSWLEEHGYG